MKRFLLFLVVSFSLVFGLSAAEREIELRKLLVKTDIAGQFAKTEVLMELYNPNSRVMEHELNIPLSESQSVLRFALDIDGEMVDAVPVEKAKGREVFEDVVRRGVDPALLEKTVGNNFKLSVYPINPGKSRKVRIVYTEMLAGSGSEYDYYFRGASFGGKAAEVRVKASVSEVEPQRYSFAFPGTPFNPVRNRNAYVATAEGRDVVLGEQMIHIEIPRTENSVAVGDFADEKFFMYQMPAPQVSTEGEALDIQRGEPIVILWDASLSQKKMRDKYCDFLQFLFESNRNCDVSLIVFRDVPEEAKRFIVRGRDWSSLRDELQRVVYDGCASYDFLDGQQDRTCGNAFLFSDGMDSYSERQDISKFAENLFCITSGAGSNPARLKGLVRKTKGKVIMLDDFSDMADAVSEIKKPDDIAIKNSFNIKDAFVERIGDRIAVLGMIADQSKNIRMEFDDGASVIIDISKAFDFDAIAKIWAYAKIRSLQEESRLRKAEIRRISKKYGVVTDESSLIVLESAADYVKYGIDPPEMFRDEYDRILSSQKEEERTYLSSFKSEWDKYVEWWQKDFPKDKKKPVIYKSGNSGRELLAPAGSNMVSAEREYALAAATPVLLDSAASGAVLREESEAGVVYDYASPVQEAAMLSEASESTAVALKSKGGDSAFSAAINIAKWNPDSDFAKRIREASSDDAYLVYLDERDDYETSPGFYLECSEMLLDKGLKALSRRVLSNLAEISMGNRSVLKLLGSRLLQLEENRKAVMVFSEIMEIAPNEPQSYMDLGTAYERLGDHQKAVEILYEIITATSMRSFPAIRLIAMKEINAIIFRTPGLDISFIDPYFVRNMPLDLRVSLSWDTDNTDIDLHVIDPNNEETYYGHKQSYQGGLNSPDNTSGFGPEDYSLKIAKKGKYRVEVNFYGNYQQKLTEGTYIYLDFYTNWGTDRQERKPVVMKLKDKKSRVFVGEIEV